MIHEDFLIDAVKYVIMTCAPDTDLVGLDKKINAAIDEFEETHSVNLILVDAYDVRQSFQKLRDNCQRVFETEINDALLRTLGTVQEEFNNQLDQLETALTNEILGDE